MPLIGVFWTHRFPAYESVVLARPLTTWSRTSNTVSADFLTPFRPRAPGWRTSMWLQSQMSMPDPAHQTRRIAWREQRERVPSPGFTTPRAHPGYKLNNTFRPAQRAYLMHYCWLIGHSKFDPDDVPAYQPIGDQRDPVDIDWVHRDAKGNRDIAASWRASLEMVNGFKMAGLRMAPALDSNHVRRQAIDIDISWHGDMDILNANGNTIRIETLPATGPTAGLSRSARPMACAICAMSMPTGRIGRTTAADKAAAEGLCQRAASTCVTPTASRASNVGQALRIDGRAMAMEDPHHQAHHSEPAGTGEAASPGSCNVVKSDRGASIAASVMAAGRTATSTRRRTMLGRPFAKAL
jgi:hypothetical protein